MTIAVLAAIGFADRAQAQFDPLDPAPTLRNFPVPAVPGLDAFVQNRAAAIVLGKALFWDQQVGSDGVACATCHFHAGTDGRTANTLSPTLAHTSAQRAGVFDLTQTGIGGPNYQLRLADFPMHVLANPDDRDSAVLFDSDDIVGSTGAFRRVFTALGRTTTLFDTATGAVDATFQLGALNARQVTSRNAPSVINAAYNFRNFLDGRANNVFNGQSPFGPRDAGASVLKYVRGRLVPTTVRLTNCSLASQAVGPANNALEMAASGRTFPLLGRKLLDRKALAFQAVASDDSVLGRYAGDNRIGLDNTYRDLIQRAFRSEWWTASSSTRTAAGFTQIENNFALFFGLAIQLYESTLVSDDTPYDRFVLGNTAALTAQQQRGLALFRGRKASCAECHSGPDFTSAGLEQFDAFTFTTVEWMQLSGRQTFYDLGFYNIGVRPTAEDIGQGANDPFGYPLSFARQWEAFLRTGVEPIDVFGSASGFAGDPNAHDGAFKVPDLRNVELTGPYFHNGGYATLEQVLEFYDRGGDRRQVVTGGDTSGFGTNLTNANDFIRPLGLTAQEQADIVAFLKSLTDERVRQEMAPFDHPQLAVAQGHAPALHAQLGAPQAADVGFVLPAIGRRGRPALGLPPLKPLHERLQ